MSKEEIDEIYEVARYSITRPSGYGIEAENHANFTLANEYLDFKEFLEGELDDFDEVMDRFIAKQAKRNLEGYDNIGFPIKFTTEKDKEKVLKNIKTLTHE